MATLFSLLFLSFSFVSSIPRKKKKKIGSRSQGESRASRLLFRWVKQKQEEEPGSRKLALPLSYLSFIIDISPWIPYIILSINVFVEIFSQERHFDNLYFNRLSSDLVVDQGRIISMTFNLSFQALTVISIKRFLVISILIQHLGS